MKVSVIVPIYNLEKYLRRCLDSIVNQSYENLEIIPVNDGSPDACGAICDEYAIKDERIRVVHKDNGGVSSARNAGMGIASGEYIFFIDGDDFLEECALESLINRAKDTNAHIVVGNFKTIDDTGKIRENIRFKQSRLMPEECVKTEEKFNYFFAGGCGRSSCNKLYSSKLIEETGIIFSEEIIMAEDWLFNLELFVRGVSIELVDEFTYYYYKRQGSLMNSYNINIPMTLSRQLELFCEYLQSMERYEENTDLICFISFTVLNSTGLNVYKYPKNRFSNIAKEIKSLSENKTISDSIKELARGKYLDKLSKKDWKTFVRVFSVFYSRDCFTVAALLLIFRYAVIKK